MKNKKTYNMKHFRLFFILLLVMPLVSQGQTETLADYEYTTGIDALKWVDMSSATVILNPTDCDTMTSSMKNIGFGFPFGMLNYTQYSVNIDGDLRLGGLASELNCHSSPFSMQNANRNNPKINAFGCNGYGVSGLHYVKAATQTLGTGTENPRQRLVVEFCMGTFSTLTRNNLYKWQVHLYSDGNIDIVFPSASGIPTEGPAVDHQCGFCISSTDGWIVSSVTNAAQYFTAGSALTIPAGIWFDANRYYSFIHPDNVTCRAPYGLAVGDVTTSGATLSWTAGGSESLWRVELEGTGTLLVANAATNSYLFSNLTPNSEYRGSVRAICGAGDTSVPVLFVFRTGCLALSDLPYSNGFEDDPYYPTALYDEAFPNCWRRINDATGNASYYPYVSNSANYVHSGSKGMYWFHSASSSAAQNQYAVLPGVDLSVYDIADLTISFYARTTNFNNNPVPVIGVMTDPDDTSTFTAVHTFADTDITFYWQLFIVPLAGYTGSGNYIAIKWPNPHSTSYLAIDDLTLTSEWCDMPSNVTASATSNTVTVRWERNGGSHFRVILGNDTVVGITDTFYTFTNLLDNTTYGFSVATECSTSHSLYVSDSIRTLCSPLVELPFVEGFEGVTGTTMSYDASNNLPYCWSYHNEGTNFAGYPLVYASSLFAHSGNQALKFYTNQVEGIFADQYAIMPLTDASLFPVNHLKVTFWMRANTASYNSYCVVGVMGDASDAASFIPVDTVRTGRSTAFESHTVLLSSYTGPHGSVAFKFPQPVTGNNIGYIDDITLEAMPPCTQVVSHNVTPTASSAIVTWEYEPGYTAGEERYEVRYGLAVFNLEGAPADTVSDRMFLITGLDADNSYMVSIKPLCSEANNTAHVFTFSTLDATSDCMPPAVEVQLNETGNLMLRWLPGYQETSWRFEYRAIDSASWNCLYAATSNMSYIFHAGELTTNTAYLFRVTANCPLGSSSTTVTYMMPCVVVSLPYTCGFEGLPTGSGSNPPDILCWHHLNSAMTNFGYPYIDASAAHSGNRGLHWKEEDSDFEIVVLPSVDITENPINTLQLSFWAKATDTSYSPVFLVGVMTAPDDANTFQLVDSVVVDHSTVGWNGYDAILGNYSGNGSYVAIRANRSSGSWQAYMDDITLQIYPNCPRVTGISADSITTTSVVLSWNSTSATRYEVQYGPSGFALGSGISVSNITSDNLAVNGLTRNTEYDVYVRGICSEDTGSWSFVYTFRTDCGLIDELPLFEDFESHTAFGNFISANNAPFIPCWTRLNNATRERGIPYVSSMDIGDGHTPGSYKYIYWVNTTVDTYGDYAYMILPQIDTSLLPINTLRLSIWGKSLSSAYSAVFEVGVMNNNTDTAFQLVDTIRIGGSTTWREFITDFNNYQGSGSYIAIRSLRAQTSYTMFDDITLDRIPPCPCIGNLVVNPSLNAATISWSDTSTNAGWNIEYDTVPFAPGTGHTTPIHVIDTFFTITALEAATLYHLYVYPDCPDGIASRHTTFTTLVAPPATVPYRCDFEQEGVNGWNIVNGLQHNYWIVGNAVEGYLQPGGNRSLYITDDGVNNHYGQLPSSVYAYRPIDLQIGNYVCSFDWKAVGENSHDYIRAALVPATYNLNDCDFNNPASLSQDIVFMDGGTPLNRYSTWQTHVEYFTITSAGTYNLVFFWHNNYDYYYQPPAAIDNIYLIYDNCPSVANISTNLTSSSIELSWTPGYSEIAWEVIMAGPQDTGYMWDTTIITTSSFLATGLQEDADYVFFIRAVCSNVDTSLPSRIKVRTLCNASPLPYFENFDTYTMSTSNETGVIPPCWRTKLTTSVFPEEFMPQIYYNNPGNNVQSFTHSGNYCYRLYGAGYYMLPPMPVPLYQLQITFWDYTTSGGLLHVGVFENDSFVTVGTVSATPDNYTACEVDFSNYTGNSRIIAFRKYDDNIHYLDDIAVDYIPTCPSVLDVTSDGIGATSLSLDWIDRIFAPQWEIRYAPVNSAAQQYNSLIVSSHPAIVTGLDSLTEYEFYVRPICSDGDTGAWSLKSILSTEACDNVEMVSTGAYTWTSKLTPLSPTSFYSLTEFIIDASELSGITDIESIAFHYNSEVPLSHKNDVSIWLQPTNQSTFSSGGDFIVLDTFSAIRVYHSSLNCTKGWNYFNFNNIYSWDGYSNLLVIIDDNSHTSASSSDDCSFSLSFRSGSSTLVGANALDYNPLSSSTANTLLTIFNYRPTIKLVSCGEGCHKPSLLPVTNITTQGVTINWNSSAPAFEIALRPPHSGWQEAVTVSDANSYHISNLQPFTQYSFRIRALCGDSLVSDWAVGSFETSYMPCPTPTEFHLVSVGGTTATLAWTADASQNRWGVSVWTEMDANYHTRIISSSPSVTLSDLEPYYLYHAVVNAICGDGIVESGYSDTISFIPGNCFQVTGVSVSDIRGKSALVRWNTNGRNKYEIEYGDRNFTLGNGTVVTNITGDSFTLTGLEAEHDYSLFVRALCNNVNGDWSEQVDFSTNDDTVGISTVQNSFPELQCYPNPTSDATTIAISGVTGEIQITIVDINGRTVRELTVLCGNGDCSASVEVGGLTKGTYFIRAWNGQRSPANGTPDGSRNLNLVKKLVVN